VSYPGRGMHVKPHRLWIAAALLCLAAAPASATKYAAEFLKIPVGARAVGLGGAFTAIADDATSTFWNPAGMVYLPYKEAFLQHAEQFGSLVNHNFGGVVFPMRSGEDRRSAFGVSLTWVGVDDIPVTPRPGGLRPGDWLDYGTDNDPTTPGNGQGNGQWDPGERLLITSDDLFMASSTDLALGVSYARQRGRHFAWGGTVKFVRQSIPDTLAGAHVTSFGAGLDAAALWMPTDAVTVSAVMRDLTTTYITWSNGTREFVAPNLTTGVAFQFQPGEGHALTWGTDLAWDFEGRDLDGQMSLGPLNADLRTGLEYWFRNTVALRSGLNGKDLAFGAGVRYRHFGADYAASLNRFFAKDDPTFSEDHNLETTHQLSASISW
jgi:hypothetical protein